MNEGPRRSAYEGERIAFLTRHDKERAIGPIFADRLGAAVEGVRSFDTDSLGTFTGEIPRAGTQVEAARKKARLAIELSGARVGLGSEGSFAPGPLGFGVRDLEILVLIDDRRGIEVSAAVDEPGLLWQQTVATREELAAAARSAGFPTHGLILRGDPRSKAIKGLRTWPELEAAFAETLRTHGRAFLENDLRAHLHPSRMAAIARAGEALAERILSTCPACGTPGFGVVGVELGLPCEDCGEPTSVPVADELRCVKCPERAKRRRGGKEFADAARCDRCNP